ncbi:MAG: type II/IV secretion system protein [Pseudomonadales bacterium]|nr:type II/IV secretion system protein [Halieaceae bacterium]MCP5163658.1 type II/IV secretion system protein [Pseudomonadales bacterium]MCP5189282.1 type II/IV secretion system protein [Pseudomonadales bacterium]MCP5204458.1 type II/IV secretion system protein [Pseudomonadales bacterium]
MATNFGEQLMEHRLSLASLARDLHGEGRLSDRDLARLLAAQAVKAHPLVYLSEQKLEDGAAPGCVWDMDALLAWLGARVGQQVYQIDPLKINVTAVAEVMSRAFAERHRILAVAVTSEEVVVASGEPFIHSWESNLEHVLRKRVRRVLSDPRAIARHTAEFYTMAGSVRGARGGERTDSGIGVTNLEQMLELGSMKEPDANDQHIVNIVDWLLQYAFEQRASDIHIEPRREVGNVRFRIDGVLHSVYELPQQVCAAVTSRIKILGRMDVAEKRRPQDGRLKTRTPEGNEVELRLATLPTAFGEKLVMRIFDPDVLQKSFEQLGLADEDLRRWHHMTSLGNGIVLVTGPTGSGKTTTLYSTLRQLATAEVNVCTIEDPIEMVEGAFNQMQVNHAINLDFSAGVRALMRQDPDIIMVGEIRDLETANMAVQAALTGHLVLSTLHTNDSPSSISRLLELGVPAYLIKATVRGVMSQRLVRILCPACKTYGELDNDAWQQLTHPWQLVPPPQVARPVGCKACRDTGYVGRQGIYEVLVSSPAVQARITSQMESAAIREVAMREGMHTLRLSGATRVAAGETTIEEVMRVAPRLDA